MNLDEYKKKREFLSTPEPKGNEFSKNIELVFVVQEHHATRFHYDFRLESKGVLKSWAVPKEPSMDHKVKRLAIMAEDHPYEYKDFEGVIPKGNYGAGKVLIWDKGTYEIIGKGKNPEDIFQQELDKGHLKFILHGEKLTGEFSLTRINSGKNEWLLVKKEDFFSAKSNTSSLKQQGAEKSEKLNNIKPMLSSLTDKPFDSEDWLFEIKWDGYRAIAEVYGKNTLLYSRNNISFNDSFPNIVESLNKLNFDAVFDGEIVALDKKGRASFQLLQQYKKNKKGNYYYYIFDILYLNGFSLLNASLIMRKKILNQIIPKEGNLRISDFIEKEGSKLYQEVLKSGLEGIIGKNKFSKYRPGIRSKDWYKIKSKNRQEVVIGGFTEPRGSRKEIGAIVCGVYENNDLIYVGHTGGGLNEENLKDLKKKLEQLEISENPFKNKPKTNAPVHWVKPKLVAEIEFSEWTDEQIMRQPIFLGLREDKYPKDVRKEKETKPLLEKKVNFSNLDKIYFPKDGYRKKDVIEYYDNISAFILPYLKDRPESLHRFPNGIDGERFYQKNITGPIPSWLKTYTIYSESEDKNVKYLICNNKESLLYVVNLGAIEINPWLSRIPNYEFPDYCVIDLDPLDVSFNEVVRVAKSTKAVLDELSIDSYLKTSGSTGLHIYIPLGAKYTFIESQNFAQIITMLVHKITPKNTSIERSPEKRKGKVYLDFLQNRLGQTIASPYSVRPRNSATVSTPLFWEELGSKLSPLDFTIKTIFKRLEKYGDIWESIFKKSIDIEKTLKKIEVLFSL